MHIIWEAVTKIPAPGCGCQAHAGYRVVQALNGAKLTEVRLVAGELVGGTIQRPQRMDIDMQLAVDGLFESGIDVGSGIPVVEAQKLCFFSSTPWHPDRPLDQILQSQIPDTDEQLARPSRNCLCSS